MIDKRFVLLSKEDNVFVCAGQLLAGESVCLEGVRVEIAVDINIGHKIARGPIAKGEKIFKYGASIGSAKQAIEFGEHVHLHNMKSDYIASHTRENRVGED